MHFTPCLRDHHRTRRLFDDANVFIRQFAGLFAQTARHNGTHLRQLFIRFGQFARRRQFDRLAILSDDCTFLFTTAPRRVLPPDFMQFNRANARMPFNGQQRIGSLDRSMLARVT